MVTFTSADYLAGPFWLVPALGGSPRRLGDLVGHAAAWFPDGKAIIYANGPDLYSAKDDGSEWRKFLTLTGPASWLRWSPDGNVLRFTSKGSSLWEVRREGSHLHRVLADSNVAHAECCGTWTPDGKYFIFVAWRNGRWDIWAIREKGGLLGKAASVPIQLTTGPLNFVGVIPSVDGKRLFAVASQPRGQLTRYDMKSRQFVPYLSGISAEGVDFSRDGAWATYVAFPEETLWRGKIDGSKRLQLTSPPLRVFLPHWSPDGKSITFMGQLPGKSWKIYIVPAEGGQWQQVTSEEHDEGLPYWSPDGNSLAFDGSVDPKYGIRVLDLRTHQVSVLPGSEGLFGPVWSPDGRYIAATPIDMTQLLLLDFKTERWTELARVNANYIKWSRDGRYLYFDTILERDPALVRLRVSDHNIERLVSLKNFRRAWGTFGPWSGLAPDDSPLVLRDVGTQEIYALDWQAP